MRKDAYKVKDALGSNNILIDLKPNRCDSAVYSNTKIDVTNFCNYIDKLKKKYPDLTYYHGMVMIMGKCLYSRPLMNRFVANRTLYMHKDVNLAFTAKAEFNDKSVEFLANIVFKETDTLLDISKYVKDEVDKIRNNSNQGGANDIIDTVGRKFPKFLRVFTIGVLKFLDKHGWLPSSLTSGNIYYSSAILTNIGVFKTGAIYHNLTNFGTSSSLIAFGEIKEEGKRKYMELGATIDERIADGFYFCKCLKLIEYMFEHPEVMMEPAGQKVSIPKEK